MFESLQTGLLSAVKTLRGKGKLTEANMRDGLKLVEMSMLEADVSHSVVQDFMDKVTEKALGQKVLLSLDPSQHVIGIVRDELIELLGATDEKISLPRKPSILMLCGLQGSGKTTTCGKLARTLQKYDKKVMLVAADLQRPAAIDQLHVLGEQIGAEVFSDRTNKDPVDVCQKAVQKAKDSGADVVILDTAGRLAIDKELMEQLQRVESRVRPDQVFLVVDGMTGQDAVNSARAFNEALELDGVIMTKLDGDARGGALLSVRHVTGVPLKFIGTGEKLDALEPFRAEGMANRILGLGDILGLVDAARDVVSAEEQAKLEERLKSGKFTLDDFRGQLMAAAKPGLLQKMMLMMPGMGPMREMIQNTDATKEIKRQIAIIDSMTKEERRNPKVIEASRRNRIAKGAGVQGPEITQLLKTYDVMAPLITGMANQSLAGRMTQIQDLQRKGMFDPGASLTKPKGDTGKRLTNEERAKLKKQREKELRKRKREQRAGDN
jgi:signal recognition particle subunit SRP54